MSEMQMPNSANVGWVCPICGMSIAPWVSVCPCKSSDIIRGPRCENVPRQSAAELSQKIKFLQSEDILLEDKS